MITPDANIILYAYNEDAPKHSEAKKCLEEQFSSSASFGLSWQVITAFLRISTNPRAFPTPFKGALAHLNIKIIEEDIRKARNEMWRGYTQDTENEK